MTIKQQLAVIAASILLAALLIAAFPAKAQQQEKMLPGEDQDRLQVAVEQANQMQAGIVVNAARVRAQGREIDRLNGEIKAIREKCGQPCKDEKK